MGNFLDNFARRINKKQINIAVVGLGYVGLPLAIEFAKRGFKVFGIDVDKGRLKSIREKESYITDVPTSQLREVINNAKFSSGDNFGCLKETDVVIICVPTPLKRKYHPDISYIKMAVKSISRYLKTGALIILESTTYPGTTEEIILPILEKDNFKHNRDFYLCFSPERIDPGNKSYPVNKIPKVIGGLTPEATKLGVLVYKNIIDRVVPVSSSRTAEAVKLLENTFRLINIALIDELAIMADKMNINIWEVISAASTKPFGFMPFYPGPGVGGHCLDKNETVVIKTGNLLKIVPVSDFVDSFNDAGKQGSEILSFDPVKRKSVFRKVTAVSAREYRGNLIKIQTQDGRCLKVTDLHPMFIYNGNKWELKYAKDLNQGDRLPICLELPQFGSRVASCTCEIDIIEQIRLKGNDLADKIRVKPRGFLWKQYSKEIKNILRKNNRLPDTYWDYLKDNFIPLKCFFMLDSLVSIDHHCLDLVTGRGPSYSEFSGVIRVDEDFSRLIGYYLSEGCFTKDKSARIRFSFNRSEKEYIEDVINILNRLGIRSSIYESKAWSTSCIKVSSNIFGFLINDILGCGKNCYEMKIPEQFLGLDKEKKKALLAGIYRGDGCVEHFFGKWRYRRNNKVYLHNVNTANISFFTSSKKLFEQLIILLHDLNIVPTFKRRKYSISVFGYQQVYFFKDLFAGKKKEIIEQYLVSNKNHPKNKTFQLHDSFASVKIKSLSFAKAGRVYSVETEKPHSFITSYGIVVHNCIPKDPLYLYWKARHFGFRSRFIKLASDIINYMPEYVVTRVGDVLKEKHRPLKGARILVIGVTYKKDIKDLRKSPALDIIEILKLKHAHLHYFDPLIPYLQVNGLNLKSVTLEAKELKSFDCVIIATDHSCIDYNFILNNSQLVFDTRNVYKSVKDKRLVRL